MEDEMGEASAVGSIEMVPRTPPKHIRKEMKIDIVLVEFKRMPPRLHCRKIA